MIGLLDCNNFYVSCERLFNMGLINSPVVILSNNDGCVISRSNEAKQLGIKMGEPFFKIREKIKALGIHVYSSNYSLYADISRRVMNIIKEDCAEIEVYSIDEAFINLSGIKNDEEFCSNLRKKILKWTGIPVSIGIGKTKTLAKIANRVVKKQEIYNLSYSFIGVYKIECVTKFKYILKKTNIEDIWGVGRNIAKFFKSNGIINAFDFIKINENFARQEKGILIKKTILELRGINCYPLEIKRIDKKSIRVSRSFGKKISSYEDLESSLIVYTQKATEKLRDYKLFCNSITVFLETSRYRNNYYKKSDTFLFLQAEIDSRRIWAKAKYLLNKIYLKNTLYNKIGIILSNFSKEDNIQNSLFDYSNKNSVVLMRAFDDINKKFGEGKIRISSDKYGVFCKNKLQNSSKGNDWFMKSDFCSPCYTTRWCDIPKVEIK
jgi:DNA polymerase V